MNLKGITMNNRQLSKEFLEKALNAKDISQVIKDLNPEELDIFIDSMEDISNRSGVYGFHCKHCNLSAMFNSKEEKRFYELFHKVFGCSLEYKLDIDGNSTGILKRSKALSKKFRTFADFLNELNEKDKEIEESIKRATGEIEKDLHGVEEIS